MRYILAVLFAVLGVAAASAEDAGKQRLAEAIHTAVIKEMPEYQKIQQTKAATICIDWKSPVPGGIKIHMAFSAWTADYSDAPIFSPKLKRSAILRCEEWAAHEKVKCTCQVLDQDGVNVLEVP